MDTKSILFAATAYSTTMAQTGNDDSHSIGDHIGLAIGGFVMCLCFLITCIGFCKQICGRASYEHIDSRHSSFTL